MSDFQINKVGGGDIPRPSKKFKLSKPMILIGGGVIIVLFLLLNSRRSSSQEVAGGDGVEGVPVGYPGGIENGVDVQSQLDQFGSIMTGQLDAALNSALTQIRSEQQQAATDLLGQVTEKINGTVGNVNDQLGDFNEVITDIGEANKEYQDKITENLNKQLEELNKKNEQLQTDLDKIKNTPAPATPKPKDPYAYENELRKNGTEGQKKWANQMIYAKEVLRTGTAGQKKWAEEELKKLTGKK